MLVEFRTENFKNFDKELILKLDSSKKYEFSLQAVKNGILKTSVVYGKNGSGKTNLGYAMLDITTNLSDKHISDAYKPFLNLTTYKPARFYYKFIFDSTYVVYEYEKKSSYNILKERLEIDGKTVIEYDHISGSGMVGLKGAENLITKLADNISYVKFVKNNTSLEENKENKAFKQFLKFVDNMLFFSSLEINRYLGFRAGYISLDEGIADSCNINDFQIFLEEAGIYYNLELRERNGAKAIVCVFPNKKEVEEVSFFEIASTGTKALAHFYFWLSQLDKVSFVYIDEFDAFYHHKLSQLIVKQVLKKDTQAIFTTHNTTIMSNDILRPDCYLILENGLIRSIADLTDKELREAHNIEKMYRAGSFNE